MPETNIRVLMRRARRNFPDTGFVPSHTLRHNRKSWVRSVLQLGSNWVLAPGSTYQGLWAQR